MLGLKNETPYLKSNPSLFSIIESDDHYLLSIDLPTLPTEKAEVFCNSRELLIEGVVKGCPGLQKIFDFRSAHGSVEAIYNNGVLYLALPKKSAGPKLKVV